MTQARSAKQTTRSGSPFPRTLKASLRSADNHDPLSRYVAPAAEVLREQHAPATARAPRRHSHQPRNLRSETYAAERRKGPDARGWRVISTGGTSSCCHLCPAAAVTLVSSLAKAAWQALAHACSSSNATPLSVGGNLCDQPATTITLGAVGQWNSPGSHYLGRTRSAAVGGPLSGTWLNAFRTSERYRHVATCRQ